jgi:hypothetical protein
MYETMYETTEEPIGVLVCVTADGLIAAIASTVYRQPEAGWREIDRGLGDRYRHAQGNYLPGGLLTGDSNLRWMTAPTAQHPAREPFVCYQWQGESWGVYLRTPEELAQSQPQPEADGGIEGRVTRLEQQTGEMEQMLDMLLSGVVEDE